MVHLGSSLHCQHPGIKVAPDAVSGLALSGSAIPEDVTSCECSMRNLESQLKVDLVVHVMSDTTASCSRQSVTADH